MLWTILAVMAGMWAFGKFAATGGSMFATILLMALALGVANVVIALVMTRDRGAAVERGATGR